MRNRKLSDNTYKTLQSLFVFLTLLVTSTASVISAIYSHGNSIQGEQNGAKLDQHTVILDAAADKANVAADKANVAEEQAKDAAVVGKDNAENLGKIRADLKAATKGKP
jgi:hypothetical protein